MEITIQELEEIFKNYPLYSQRGVRYPLVIVKLLIWNTTWYLTEYDPDVKIAYGFTEGMKEDEFGYINILN